MNAPVDVSFFPRAAKPLTSYRKFWAARFGTASHLPMSRAEMDKLGWDSCDIVLVTGDAYVDHPSFGMAVIGRMLEAQGFRVGIIAQPDWQSAEPFRVLGKPNLFWGVTAGNMDSMINRYTADRKIRTDDAYTPGDVGGKRPDRAALVQSGWAMMPTRKPWASSMRPITAMPKLGWSTYASPVTSTMSQLSQPSLSISARLIGKCDAVPKRAAQNLR